MKKTMKKTTAGLLCILLLLPLMLASCNDPYYNGGAGLPPVGGEQEQKSTFEEQPTEQESTPTSETVTPEPEKDQEHLFNQEEFLEELFTGLSKDHQYLIADFTELLKKHGIENLDEKKFLFVLENGLDEETLEAVKEELEDKKPLLEKLSESKEGKEVVEYAIYMLESDPSMKKIAVSFYDTTLGKQVVGVYEYVMSPKEDLPLIPPETEPADPTDPA